jgi:hypothetical protein
MQDITAHQALLEDIVGALCSRPGEGAARRSVRVKGVVGAVEALSTGDPVSTMIAGMAVTHFHLILDAARDVLGQQNGPMKARETAAIAALGRAMNTFLKSRRPERPAAAPKPVAEPATPEAETPARKPDPVKGPMRTATAIGAMMSVVSPPSGPFFRRRDPPAPACLSEGNGHPAGVPPPLV